MKDLRSRFQSSRGLATAALFAATAAITSLHAQILLTPTHETQLETWLGQGNLNFTNIFTKVAGDVQGSSHFHSAVDFRGPTITLMQVTTWSKNQNFVLPTQVIGGYNPLDWKSDNSLTVIADPADRTAFIFNLTIPTLYAQKLTAGSPGLTVAHNNPLYGPRFGIDADILVQTNLEDGQTFSRNASYGPDGASTITMGGAGIGNGTDPTYDYFSITNLEIYTFNPAPVIDLPPAGTPVPEPSTYGLLGAATLLVVLMIKRKGRASQSA